MISFTCQNCGATTSAVALGSSIRCPFCGTEHVIAAPEDANAPRPEALLPFAFPDDQVERIYRSWLGSGFFRPKDITEKAHSHKMRPVYVPIWEAHGQARSRWTAQAGYTEEAPAPPAPSGQPVDAAKPPATDKRTRWEPASGTHSGSYDRLLVSASKGLPQGWIGRLGDLDWGQVKGYDPNFLIGREAEQATLDRGDALTAAREQIEAKERDACAALVPGDTQKELRVGTEVVNLAARLVYLPVWLASFQYGDKTYRCVVNGQSGAVSGEAPVNRFRAAAVAVGVILLIVAIVILVRVLG